MLKQLISFLLIFLINHYCYSTTKEKSKTALFISIPFIGHINPLLNQAIELYHRYPYDYNIYIISCSNIKTYVEQNSFNTTIQFLDIGQCFHEKEFLINLEYIASQSDFLLGASILFQQGFDYYYSRMYEQMLNTISPNIFHQQQKIIAIIDRVTYAGADLAEHYNIPYIINAASLLPYLDWHDILPSDYNPPILHSPPLSIHSLGTNLFFRFISPLIRYYSLVYIYFRYDQSFNYLRGEKYHINNTSHIWLRYHSHLYLVNNVFGFEYAHDIPPNVILTGPMISIKKSRKSYLNELFDEERQWIELDIRPIIYINFGTCVPITNKQIEKIFHALKSLDKYRIIWKINNLSSMNLIIQNSTRFRIVQWISSTFAYLSHSNIQLFISHCGINSIYESIWFNTSIICIPILADQQDMAQRLEDVGIGKWLDKLTFTSEQLKQTIEFMFQSNEILLKQENIKRIQTFMKLHGGVERAVDFIEMVIEYDIKSLIPINRFYPWYAYYNLDVYIIWILILIGLKQIVLRCCCCSYYHRKFPTNDKLKKKIN